MLQLTRLCGTLGVQVLTVAIGWHVYDVSQKPLYLGFVGLAQFAPSLVLALVGGHVADRFDRRRIMLGVIVVQLGCSAVLGVAASGTRLWPVYVVAGILGSCRAFLGPAMQALMPRLVPPAHFSNAVAWHLVSFQLGLSLGPAIGGLAYGGGGAARAFGLGGGLFVVSLIAAMLMRTPPMPAVAASRGLTTVLAGLRYVRRQPLLLGAMSLDLFAVLLGGAIALSPIFARDILHTGPMGLGLLRAAPAVGASVMALYFAARPLERRLGTTIFGGVLLFGIANATFGLSRDLWLSLVALTIAGAADMTSLTVRHTIVQLSTPDGMRGRVSAVASIFVGASNELGEMQAGLMATWLGATRAVVLGGVLACAVSLTWMRLFPQLRRLGVIGELRGGAP